MSGFNLLHLVTKGQPVTLRACSLPSGARRTKKTWPVSFTKEELKERLTPMQYHVTQERGTESAFTGELTFNKEEGTYSCVVCGAPLFSSKTKFDSGSGWPSFYDLLSKDSIDLTDDFSYGMRRVETTCSKCGSHLGHVFDDGPRPTRKRYCINSASLAFRSQTSDLNQDSAGLSQGPETESKSEPQSGPETESKSEPQSGPGTESKSEPQSGPETESKSEPQSGPGTGTGAAKQDKTEL